MAKEPEQGDNEIFGRDTIPADFDDESSADVPEYLMETQPAESEDIAPTQTHVGAIESDDSVSAETPAEKRKRKDDEYIADRKKKASDALAERKKKAEELREKRAVEKAVKDAEKAIKQEENTKRRAKKVLQGVQNLDLPLGWVERILGGGFLLLLERGHYWVAFLLLAFSAVLWYGKIKVGEGKVVKAVRNTGIKEFETVLVKISQTLKNQ